MNDNHEGEQSGYDPAVLVGDAEQMHTCLHCKNDFRDGDGVVTADAAICDVCNY